LGHIQLAYHGCEWQKENTMAHDKNSNKTDLIALARKWDKQLRKFEYAGEIVIPESRLNSLANYISLELVSDTREFSKQVELLVLAINCMYYKHDEHGYWIHFCNLLKVVDDNKSHDLLGGILENQLLQFGFISESEIRQRRGRSFRYVTPIRDQCGITRQEINRFAEILTGLSEMYGWPGILALNRNTFNRYLENKLHSGHLYRFLNGDSGWDFCQDVVRVISQFQRNVLKFDDLKKLKGYRSGFFVELFKALDRPPEVRTQSVIKPLKPRYSFLPDFSQVAIVFERTAVHNSDYQFNGTTVSNSPIICSKNHFIEEIKGIYRDSKGEWSDWIIDGWDPEKSPTALFHENGGLMNLQHKFIPGNYFYIAPFDSKPPNEVQISEHGMVDLPFPKLDHVAWLISINEKTDLSFIDGVDEGSSQQSTEMIRWNGRSAQLISAIDIETVFFNNLPSIQLLSPGLFETGAVGLFIDDGSGPQRVAINNKSNLINLDIHAPAKGRVWVEPISRLREFSGLDILNELAFLVIPECEIQWPIGLYNISSQPTVSVKCANSDITFEFDDGISVGNGNTEWKIKQEVEVAQGYIKYYKYRIRISHRVYRASIIKKGRINNYFFITDKDFEMQVNLIANGVARDEVNIGISDGEQVTPLITNGTFNEAGEYRFSTMAVRDALRSFKSPIGIFTIKHKANDFQTRTYLLNISALEIWILDAAITNFPNWFSLLNSEFKQMVETIIKVRDYPARELQLPETSILIPYEFLKYAQVIAISANVFDDTLLTNLNKHDDETALSYIFDLYPNVMTVLRWYKAANQYFLANKESSITSSDLLRENKNWKWNPPFKRWVEKIADVVALLEAEHEVTPILDEWRIEVEHGFRPAYKSHISKRPYGRELTEAWIDYNYDEYNKAFNKAKPLVLDATSHVADLAVVLLRLCSMRLCYFKDQHQSKVQSSNNKFASIIDSICYITDFPTHRGEGISNNFDALSEILSAIPFSKKDLIIIKMVISGIPDANPSNKSDWLSCYYGLILSKENKMDDIAQAYSNKLKDNIINIPPSPDRRSVIAELES